MCPWVIMGSKKLHFGGVWIKVPKDCGRNEEGRVLFAVEVVVCFFVYLGHVEICWSGWHCKCLASILIRFGQLRSYCNKNNQKHICSIMLQLVFRIELFVYKQLSKWMTWRYKNVTELMKAKPDLKMKEFSKQYAREACNSGLWTGSRIFSNSKKRWVFRLYAENFVAGVQATQNRQRLRSGMPCLTWALIQPRQRKDVGVHVWRFWVSQIICVFVWWMISIGWRK